jgi:O-acetyl-ADP-ribose deacetylase (regulator of RNase III)
VAGEHEVPAVLTGKVQVVVPDPVDRPTEHQVLDAVLHHTNEGEDPQHVQGRERGEGEDVEGISDLGDLANEAKGDEGAGDGADVEGGAGGALAGRLGASAGEPEVLGGERGEELLAVGLGHGANLASGSERIQGMAEIEVAQADITKLEVDAIANAANTELRHGGGVAGAISRAGGPEVQAESDRAAPIGLGEAIETTAGEMPSRWVIHAATMELGGPTSAEIIRRATASTLAKVEELGARSVALVAFGTGVGGFPLEEAARIEVEEVRRHLDGGSGLERVVFAVRGDEAVAAFGSALGEGL